MLLIPFLDRYGSITDIFSGPHIRRMRLLSRKHMQADRGARARAPRARRRPARPGPGPRAPAAARARRPWPDPAQSPSVCVTFLLTTVLYKPRRLTLRLLCRRLQSLLQVRDLPVDEGELAVES